MRAPLLTCLLALWGGATPPVGLRLGGPAESARKTVAVLAFDNQTGKDSYAHLGRGLATMMTTDLAAVKDIRLVERERLADVTKEIDAQQTAAFDSTTAVKVGRLAGAEFIVTGAVITASPQLRLDTRVIRVETGAIVKTATVTGKEDDLFALQQKLARQLIRDLDIALTPDDERVLDRQQAANRVDDLEAMVALSDALTQIQVGSYAEAAFTLAPVVAKYPNATVVRMTYDEIKKRAAESGKEKVKSTILDLLRRKGPAAAW